MSERWVPLDESAVASDPLEQFRFWFDEARELVAEPEAIALATASADGSPSARMVLLRHVDDDGFGFFTNYESRKGHELDENPRAALLWYVAELGRQVRVEGPVTRMSSRQSDEYFAARPRGHQIGAHASAQSRPLAHRRDLEERVTALASDFGDDPVPRPAHWGGYLLHPERYEFWQHRADRLHDRVAYEWSDGEWRRRRLAP